MPYCPTTRHCKSSEDKGPISAQFIVTYANTRMKGERKDSAVPWRFFGPLKEPCAGGIVSILLLLGGDMNLEEVGLIGRP